MKVLIRYTVEADDSLRRSILNYSGEWKPGKLATREQIKNWFRQFGDTMQDDMEDPHPDD
ncbi:hypothetical protein LCGC14_0568820 [marine sediment metagenome]|uniref:Uncharacterized protein n=1 Tax=marine sediment metagenome TaxID=412755 RepID=A0A0F9U6A4_9ZZZZ|nr:hypothetical protein [Phycisphaerae bacterium]